MGGLRIFLSLLILIGAGGCAAEIGGLVTAADDPADDDEPADDDDEPAADTTAPALAAIDEPTTPLDGCGIPGGPDCDPDAANFGFSICNPIIFCLNEEIPEEECQAGDLTFTVEGGGDATSPPGGTIVDCNISPTGDCEEAGGTTLFYHLDWVTLCDPDFNGNFTWNISTTITFCLSGVSDARGNSIPASDPICITARTQD